MSERTHVPILHKPKQKKPRKRINSVSPRMAKAKRIYAKLRKKFLEDHPICQHWLAENGWTEHRPDGSGKSVHYTHPHKILPGHVRSPWEMAEREGAPYSEEIHHKRGRGKYYLDTSTWMAVRAGHDQYLHNDPKRYEKGYMLPR